MEAVVAKFPQPLLAARAELLFLPLAARLVNDPSPQCVAQMHLSASNMKTLGNRVRARVLVQDSRPASCLPGYALAAYTPFMEVRDLTIDLCSGFGTVRGAVCCSTLKHSSHTSLHRDTPFITKCPASGVFVVTSVVLFAGVAPLSALS